MTKLHLDIQTCLALPASSAPEFSQKRASASYLPLLQVLMVEVMTLHLV